MKQSETVLGNGWPVLIFLLLATLPNTFTSTLLASALPVLARELGTGALGIERAQMLMTAPGLAMLTSPLAGWAADRYGARRAVSISLLLCTIGGLGCRFTVDFPELLALRLLLGVGVGGMMAVSLALVGACFAGQARTRVLSYRWAIMCVFSVLAVQLASWLALNFTWSTPLWVYLSALPLLIFGLLCVPDTRGMREVGESTEPSQAPRLMKELLTPTFLLAMAGNLFFAIATYSTYAQLPFLLKELGYAPTAFAQMMIPTTLASVVAALLLPRMSRFFHPVAIIAVSLVVFACGMLCFSMAGSMAKVIFASLLVGAGTVVFEPALSAFLLEKIHPSRRGLAMGGVFGTFHLGPFLIPFLFGGLNARYGFAFSAQIMAWVALALAVGILAVLGRHSVKPRLATSPT